MTDQQKAQIDDMSRLEMARLWRFAPRSHPLLEGETGDYFRKVFGEKGGMSPEISKQLGWTP